MFYCEICDIFKNTFSYRTPPLLLLYYCKLHNNCLRMFLTIPLDCNLMPYLFQLNFVFFFRHIFFSRLIPSFFTQSERTQNSLMTTRQILDVFFILIFITIVIYSYAVMIIPQLWLYLFTLAYLYLFSLYTII